MRLVFLLSFTFTILFSSCTKDKTQPPECPTEISFSQDIEPLIQTNCSLSGCHASGFTSPALTSYAEISAHAENMLSRMQLDPTNSLLMPSGGPKLDSLIISNFACWIAQGKKNN